MNIGLVGIGQIAAYQIEAIACVPGLTLVDACDRNPDRSARLLPGITFHESLDSFLRKSRADLVIVSTPNATHADVASRVLEAGRPVLLEKPAATSAAELDQLVATAQAKGIFLSVAFHAAFALDALWLLERIRSGDLHLGSPSGFHCGFYDPYLSNGTLSSAATGLGGSWYDSGINALSLVARFWDVSQLEVTEGRMTSIPSVPCSQIQGAADVAIRLPGGHRGRGSIDTNWTLGLNRKTTQLFFEASHMSVLLNHSAETVVIREGDREIASHALGTGRPRLVNHYIGLYADLKSRFARSENNLDLALPLHKLLYSAATWHLT
ncbi:MAG: Gfo/Idh/MocA family oxidoreductase [Deltaproteobacteria bacterium]|nr:Gfo/Idh/MocA family oxidoreductase [Deltaproteobacteria bacterium]